MPFDYVIAEYESGDYKLELHQWNDVDEQPPTQPLVVKNEATITGSNNDPLATHLRGELQLQLIDENNHFRDLFNTASPGEYYLKKIEAGQTKYIGFPVTDFIGGKFWKKYNTRTFVFGDGLNLLKNFDNTHTDYIQLGDFFYELLNAGNNSFNLNMVFGYQHDGASGQSGIVPQQIRIKPGVFVHNRDKPTKMDALKAVLDFFKLQIWQENGEWWIVQRNIRDDAPTVYKRTSGGWSSEAMPSAVEIARSDFREEQTEDLQFPGASKMLRNISQPGTEFATNDPFFYPKYWIDDEPYYWPGTGDVSNAMSPTRLIFDDPNPVRTQVIPRVIKVGDTINLKFRADVSYKSGLADGNYHYKVGTIKAVSLDGGSDYWLDKNGTWEDSAQVVDAWIGIGQQLNVVSGSYSATHSFDVDVDSDPIPEELNNNHFAIVITLHCVGDDVFAAADPVTYFEVNIDELEISDVPNEVLYTAELSEFQNSEVLDETIYSTDQELYAYSRSVQYWDGSAWQEADDWNAAPSGDFRLQSVIMTNYLGMLGNNLKGYRIQLPFNHHVSLSDLVTITSFEPSLNLVPFVLEHHRSEKRTVLSVASLTDSSANILTTYEVK